MKKSTPAINSTMLESLFNFGQESLPPPEKLKLLAGLRENKTSGLLLDQKLMERLQMQHEALMEARSIHESMNQLLMQFREPPWHPSIFLHRVEAGGLSRALVQYGNSRRLVTCADQDLLNSLRPGDEVYLGRELNHVLARAPEGGERGGETCLYDRPVNDEWMVVKSRDEEFVVRVGSAVIGQELHPGDQLVWDRDAGVVYGKIEKPTAQQYFLETTPQDTFESIGGLEKEIAIIQSTMEMHRNYPDVVGKFQLRRAGSILLYGPPGTGKTLLAKGLANWAARNSSSGRSRFMNIKPGALHSMWYSQSESNYREVFRTARQEVSRNPGVPLILFFDEIDSIGSSRGSSLAQTQDNVLMAFCAELDGLEARHDILVVGATNRRDVLDPALARPGRMGDLQLRVPRPNPIAARDILSKHLPANIPYARNGHGDDFAATRAEILDTVVSRIFAPNADNALATITFRDGNHKTVLAGDMISGALLANMARRALERACQREVSSGKSGLEVRDLEEALCLEFDSVAKLLTPRNCRQHLDDLPQDMDVVKIEPAAGRGRRAHRYLHIA